MASRPNSAGWWVPWPAGPRTETRPPAGRPPCPGLPRLPWFSGQLPHPGSPEVRAKHSAVHPGSGSWGRHDFRARRPQVSLQTEPLTAGMGRCSRVALGLLPPQPYLPPPPPNPDPAGPRGLCSWAGRAMGSEQHLASPGKDTGCLYLRPSSCLPWEWLPFWSCRHGL